MEKTETSERLMIVADRPPLVIGSPGARARSPLPVVLACLALAIMGLYVYGPAYLDAMQPPHDRITDYFQDWASARNHLTGRPVYTEHAVSLPLYLGMASYPDLRMTRNAHPPTSVLIAMPLGHLPFREAALAWNWFSIAAFALGLLIVFRSLGLALEASLTVLALLCSCHPLYGNLYQCQLTLFLVLLVTGVWVLDRQGHHLGAGAILGTAAAIKLFPGYLAVYYLARKQYKVLAAALISFLSWTALTLMILGKESFDDYVHLVMPGLGAFRSYAYNLSLAGFWHKLFDPVGEANGIRPLSYCPDLARVGTLLSDLTVTALVMFTAYRARDSSERDLAFSAAVTAMLLVSPITWDVSLPLLLVPLMVLAFGRNGAGNVPDSARTDRCVEGGSGIPLRLRIRLARRSNLASTSLKRKRCNPGSASWSRATLATQPGSCFQPVPEVARRSMAAVLLLGTVITVLWLPQEWLTSLASGPIARNSACFLLGMPSVKAYAILVLLVLTLCRRSGLVSPSPSAEP
jgi:alpha-1,2-mannosyltransferase